MESLGPDAVSVIPLFVSIDPKRDRVEAMAEYVIVFHPAIVGLTGTEDQVAKAVRSFKAYYEKQPQKSAPNGYTMSHTSAVYLISPNGEFIIVLQSGYLSHAIKYFLNFLDCFSTKVPSEH